MRLLIPRSVLVAVVMIQNHVQGQQPGNIIQSSEDLQRFLRRHDVAKTLSYHAIKVDGKEDVTRLRKRNKSRCGKSSKSSKSKSSKSSKSKSSWIYATSAPSCSPAPTYHPTKPPHQMSSTPSLIPRTYTPTKQPNVTSSKPSVVTSSKPIGTTFNPTSRPSRSHAPTISPSTTGNPSRYPTNNPTPLRSAQPSYIPSTEDFDLQNCDAYSTRWLLDITGTCDPFFNDCKCPTAQMLINNGKIDCENDKCPPNCTMCEFCLETVLSCLNQGTDEPVIGTDDPVIAPSQSPEGFDSFPRKPTSLGVTFDLQKCETYEIQWLLDLDKSCTGGDTESCGCEDARRRISDGEIECGNVRCPDSCEVCKFCIDEVLGCSWME